MTLLFLNNWLDSGLVQALAWTLIHSLWQGLVLAALAGIIILCTRKASALLRYNLFIGLLFLFVLGSVFTFVRAHKQAAHMETFTPIAAPKPASSHIVTSSFSSTTFVSTPAADQVINFLNRQAQWIVLLWSLFFLLHVLRLLAGVRYIHRIRYTKVEAPGEAWIQMLAHLCDRIGIKRQVLLLQSGIVTVPVVIGLVKPLILVPAGMLTGLQPQFVETILLHEMAHIKRNDFAVNLLQSIIELLFFFNPALRWLSARIREEREACCDDLVLKHTGDRMDYVQALVSFQEQSMASSPFALALKNRNAYLLNRVRRMLTRENNKLNIMEKTILFAGLLAVSAFAFIPRNEAHSRNATNRKSAVASTYKVSLIKQDAVEEKQLLLSNDNVKFEQQKAAAKEKKLPQAKQPSRDTLPKKGQERSVSTNTTDNGTSQTSEMTVTEDDGTTYRVKKVNGEITEVQVNGKTIPKGEQEQYKDKLNEMEREQKETAVKQIAAMKQRKEETQHRLTEMTARAQERSQQDQKRQEQQQHQQEVKSRERVAEQQRRSEQELRDASERNQTATTRTQHSGSATEDILQELQDKKIIDPSGDASFTLTESSLMVNGKEQSRAMQQRLKEKYKLKKGDSIEYKKEGGSTTTSIVRQ